MILKINHAAVKVRAANSGTIKTKKAKFTGAVTYSVTGRLNGGRVRHALGTEDERVAIRRVEKIKTACFVPDSPLWLELEDALPRKTFDFFADAAGYVPPTKPNAPSTKPTWTDLAESFEIEMRRLVANKARGASQEEGRMAETTRCGYRATLKVFASFLQERQVVFLDAIDKPLIEMFKVFREKQIVVKTQSRGGASIALDIAILHRIFAYAMEKGMMSANPINLKHESKPGRSPRTAAEHFLPVSWLLCVKKPEKIYSRS